MKKHRSRTITIAQTVERKYNIEGSVCRTKKHSSQNEDGEQGVAQNSTSVHISIRSISEHVHDTMHILCTPLDGDMCGICVGLLRMLEF